MKNRRRRRGTPSRRRARRRARRNRRLPCPRRRAAARRRAPPAPAAPRRRRSRARARNGVVAASSHLCRHGGGCGRGRRLLRHPPRARPSRASAAAADRARTGSPTSRTPRTAGTRSEPRSRSRITNPVFPLSSHSGGIGGSTAGRSAGATFDLAELHDRVLRRVRELTLPELRAAPADLVGLEDLVLRDVGELVDGELVVVGPERSSVGVATFGTSAASTAAFTFAASVAFDPVLRLLDGRGPPRSSDWSGRVTTSLHLPLRDAALQRVERRRGRAPQRA